MNNTRKNICDFLEQNHKAMQQNLLAIKQLRTTMQKIPNNKQPTTKNNNANNNIGQQHAAILQQQASTIVPSEQQLVPKNSTISTSWSHHFFCHSTKKQKTQGLQPRQLSIVCFNP